jgi:hypothetical protein
MTYRLQNSRKSKFATEPDIPHGLITDCIPYMLQRTRNTIVTPGAVLLGETYHQSFYLCIDLGASKCLALLGAITLLGDQLAVPGQDRLGRDDAGDLCQRPLA